MAGGSVRAAGTENDGNAGDEGIDDGGSTDNGSSVTKIIADEPCECGGKLVPPILTPLTVPLPDVDYVCLKCGRTYA